MADINKFEKLFKEMNIEYTADPITELDAKELARVTGESEVAKSRKYLMIGGTYFHFDFTGRYLGLESNSFEPRIKGGGDAQASQEVEAGKADEGTSTEDGASGSGS